MDRLAEMIEMQRALQQKINGYDVLDEDDEQRIANFKISLFALEHELHEAVDEMGWKEWATSRHFNARRVQEELVDAWHFFMNLMLHAGMHADELYDMYVLKNAINHRRQDEGYDGVTGKCPACHRDLAETELKEIIADKGLLPRVDIHCACGRYLGSRPV